MRRPFYSAQSASERLLQQLMVEVEPRFYIIMLSFGQICGVTASGLAL